MRKKKSNTKRAVFKILILFIILSINLSCENEKIETDYIYYSSFEKETDLTGWVGSYQLQNIAPPGGGHQSIYISGGCIVPHVSFELGPFSEDLNLSVECWGKNLDLGGNVTLTTEDYDSSVYLSIEDKSWKHYTTDSVIFCPAGKKLQVELSSGGFVPSSMLIDMIKIVEK